MRTTASEKCYRLRIHLWSSATGEHRVQYIGPYPNLSTAKAQAYRIKRLFRYGERVSGWAMEESVTWKEVETS